jgi:hypothetical protein
MTVATTVVRVPTSAAKVWYVSLAAYDWNKVMVHSLL